MRKISWDLQRLIGTVLLVIAPFASWATLSSFGFVIEAGLWDIAGHRTSFDISATLATTGLLAGFALVIAGLISIRFPKPGAILAVTGLSAFSVESYSIYGSFGSGIPVTILPGSGFLIAAAGTIFCLASLGKPRVSESGDRAREILTGPGVYFASLSLGIDVWNHWTEGHESAVVGTGGTEVIVHSIFLIGVPAVLIAYLVGGTIFSGRLGLGITLVALSGLLLDGVYHSATGSVVEVVGTGPVEILLHTLTYYGIVSILVVRMFPASGVTRNAESRQEREIVISKSHVTG